MPKVGMQPIRRQQLIDATIRCMSRHGFERTTVARIGRLANVSPGIINHYFGGKDELLEATMRHLLRQLKAETVQRLKHSGNPRARLEAIVDANFADEQFSPELVSAWLAFWAQAPYNRALHRLQRIYARRLRSNLRHALKQLLPAAEVERAAYGLAALIDGLWVNCTLGGEVDGERARTVARDYVGYLLTATCTGVSA